ncbi:MAG: MFS transporter [Anaerolineae bacterium]|nr:MFS transporter [Anaerolineae bacterium]
MQPARNGPTSLLIIAFLSFIIIGIPGGALGVAWIHIQGTFGLGLESLGILLTASTIGRLITAFTSGRWIARMGAGRFFLAGSLLGVVGMLGFVLAPVWPLLLAAEFVRGLGSGVIDAGINTFVAPRYSASRMNWLHACFGIGLTLGPALVTTIVIDLGQSWRWAYLLLGGLNAALAAIFLVTLSRWKLAESARPSDGPAADAGIMDTLRLLMMWLSLALFFFYGGTEIGTGQLLNSLFVEGRGIDPKTAGFWVSFYWGSFTVGRMLIGIFVDRLGPRALLRVCMLGAIGGAALIWWNAVPEMSFAGLAVMGMALAPLFPTLVALTPERVGVAHTPNAIGFQIGFAGLGAALLVGLAGVLAGRSGVAIVAPFLMTMAIFTFTLHEVIMLREARARAVPAVRP